MLFAQVEAFLEIARRGHLGRAAEAIFLSQPALTARLKGLEEELRVTLFIRSRRGMRLTDAGRAFLPHAERSLASLIDARRTLADLRRGQGGELVLGAAPAISTYVLPTVLMRFHAAHPGVRLTVRTGHSEEILEMVLRDQVQVGLVRALRHPGVESIPLYADELVLVATAKHRFAKTGRIRIQDLANEQLILFDRTSSYYELTSALFREAGVVPVAVMELDNAEAAKKMVEAGLGIALLPRAAVAAELAAGGLTAVRIAGAAVVRRRIVAIRRRDGGPPTGVVEAFLVALRELRAAPNDRRRRSDRSARSIGPRSPAGHTIAV